MTIRRVDLLIDECRGETDNVEFSSDTGINDERALKFLNDAQSRIFSLILSQTPSLFQEEQIINAVPEQEAYSLSPNAVIGSRVERVEYSITGLEKDYTPVDQMSLNERISGLSGNPNRYIRRSSTLLMQPKPQSAGKIRVTYQKRIPKLDKRRAQVSAVTLATDTITSLTLDSSLFNSEDIDIIKNEGFITVVDIDGVVGMRSIPITDVDLTTGVVTLRSGFVFESGETITVGDYVCKGANSTTHSQLPDECEKYLTQYGNWRFFKKDSSQDALEAKEELDMIEAQLLLEFAEPDTDIDRPAILDGQFMTFY